MAFREVLKRTVKVLDRAKVVYVFTGALAAGYYGLARSTRDIDLLVYPDKKRLERMLAFSKKYDFKPVGELIFIPAKMFTIEAKEGYRVDFFQAETNHDLSTLERRRRKSLFGAKVWMISPEDLIIQKLKRGRHKDIVDAVSVMARQAGKLDVERLRLLTEELGTADVFNELSAKVW